MNKLVRMARTSQTLSLAAMEEASRQGLRVADLDHLLLALVLSEQTAGQALRSLGIDIDGARRAVHEQHRAQLAALGIQTELPEPGRIVFHETAGYEWAPRAFDLFARAGARDKAGDAAAVLAELLDEPSGLIAEVLARLQTTPEAVRDALATFEELREVDAAADRHPQRRQDTSARSVRAFVPAPIAEVWDFVSDPARIPAWEFSVGAIHDAQRASGPGGIWHGEAPARRPDGKPLRRKPRYRRRLVELVAADAPTRVVWRLSYPDAPRSTPLERTLALTPAMGATTS